MTNEELDALFGITSPEEYATFSLSHPEWRKHWSFALRAFAKSMEPPVQRGNRQYLRHPAYVMMRSLSEAYLDSDAGIASPLFSIKKVRKSGRPPPNFRMRQRRFWLLATALVGNKLGALAGLNPESSYRETAKRLTNFGLSIRWRELRSAVSNRSRLSTHPEIKGIELFLAPSNGAEMTELIFTICGGALAKEMKSE